MRKPRAFLLYVEPTPYIEGLIEEIQRVWSGDLDVCYIAQDLSQDWKIDAKSSGGTILPVNRRRAIAQLWRYLRRLSRGDVVHLAGFGHPLLVAALLMGKLRGLRVFIESDTPTGQAVGGWKNAVKRVVYPPLFRLADHFLPGGRRQAAYLASYGVPNTKITIAQMTVDVASIMRYVETAATRRETLCGFDWDTPAILGPCCIWVDWSLLKACPIFLMRLPASLRGEAMSA